jgi:hypothetical protein
LKPHQRKALSRKDHFNVFLNGSHFGNEGDESSPRRGQYDVASCLSRMEECMLLLHLLHM